MILFTDTSAIIKLYVEEKGTSAMTEKARSHRFALSALAYAEIHATLARRLRESLLTEDEHSKLTARLDRDWEGILLIPVQPAILGLVPRVVKDHPLRGADAVHLASALALRAADLEPVFVAADKQLLRASQAEGFEVFNPEEHEPTG